MFVRANYPQYLHPEELDSYLEEGWFRMGRSVFTTHFLKFDRKYYSALWMRVLLKDYEPDKSQLKLLKQNAKFRYEILPLCLNETKEQLFAAYKTQLSFDASSSLVHLLGMEDDKSIYQTVEVNIYDEHKLIACGILDVGFNSTAGISCFYDPSYKKYSLGKYLMLLKMLYAKQKGYTYFYPGYFVPGYKIFDYKLDLAKHASEYYDVASCAWRSLDTARLVQPLALMEAKLSELSRQLRAYSVPHQVLYYDFFDANLMPELHGIGFLDYPIFLSCYSKERDAATGPMVLYNISEQSFHVIRCRSVYVPHVDESTDRHYAATLLKVDSLVAVGDSIGILADLLQWQAVSSS